MTNKTRRAAALDIMRSIAAARRNRPNFTMTRSQLRATIDDYCDDPATTLRDKRLIFAACICDPAFPLRATAA